MSDAAQLLPLVIADIYELAGSLRERGEQIAQTVGQTQARWQVLSVASGGRLTVPQIARRLGVTRQGVQRLADLLEADGSARFEANPDHKGSPHLALTPSGKTTLERITTVARRRNQETAEHLAASELEALHRGLRHLLSAISAVRAEE